MKFRGCPLLRWEVAQGQGVAGHHVLHISGAHTQIQIMAKPSAGASGVAGCLSGCREKEHDENIVFTNFLDGVFFECFSSLICNKGAHFATEGPGGGGTGGGVGIARMICKSVIFHSNAGSVTVVCEAGGTGMEQVGAYTLGLGCGASPYPGLEIRPLLGDPGGRTALRRVFHSWGKGEGGSHCTVKERPMATTAPELKRQTWAVAMAS